MVSTGGRAVKSGVHSPGSLPCGKAPHSRPRSCEAALAPRPASSFESLCPPLASSGSGTGRLPIPADLKVLRYTLPHAVSVCSALLSGPAGVCYLFPDVEDVGFRSEGSKKEEREGKGGP